MGRWCFLCRGLDVFTTKRSLISLKKPKRSGFLNFFVCCCGVQSFNSSVGRAEDSNQITFIVTSPQHKCLGEWNSYERAPDSAEKQQTIYIWTDSAKKQQTIYLWTDSAKKQQTIYLWTDSAKKQQTIYLWTDSAKKQQTIYIWTDSAKKLHWSIYSAPDSAKKNNNNLHMDRQCKKKNYSNLHMDRQCKKQQQFTYGQYIFTDCTEDNVQNTHTYTQYA